jgi:hypothetical protein
MEINRRAKRITVRVLKRVIKNKMEEKKIPGLGLRKRGLENRSGKREKGLD